VIEAGVKKEDRQSVADQIRKIRRETGLTQDQLADRLGTTQQNISEIEAGERSVGVGLLHRISRALGRRLEIAFKPAGDSAVQSSEEIQRRLRSQPELFQEYGIEKLILFGSAAKGELTPDSDIDMIVFSDKINSYWKLTELRLRLEEIIGCSVDLATPKMVEHIWEEEIENQGVEFCAP